LVFPLVFLCIGGIILNQRLSTNCNLLYSRG
jgi:hypothetical protein